MKRPGYYVEGKFFRDNFHQARARAAFLAHWYGRGIPVMRLDVGESEAVEVLTVHNGKREAA